MKRADLTDIIIVLLVVALFWEMFAFDKWQRKDERREAVENHQQMVADEIEQIEMEERTREQREVDSAYADEVYNSARIGEKRLEKLRQEGWQTSIQDLETP